MADRHKRFFADRFDADGRFYVFDEDDGGSECAGPFNTIGEAEAEAAHRNEAVKKDG